MKIRNHKKYTYVFVPYKDSSLSVKKFKRMSALKKFLNGNLIQALNGTVNKSVDQFGASYTEMSWTVWYDYPLGSYPRVSLRKNPFRKFKRFNRVSKLDKKFFAFSERRINLMIHIDDSKEIDPRNAKNLVDVFYKSGFKDFTPNEDDQEYINHYIQNGIDFGYWCDRCNYLRMKTIIEYFKLKGITA